MSTGRTFFPLFIVLILLVNGSLQPARGDDASPNPRDMALALEELYGKMTSLTFNFEQITRTGGRERTGRGRAIFYRGGSAGETPASSGSVMRWDYQEPDRQVIINDGVTLLIYTERDRQLIKIPAREVESDITYAFFAGNRKLLDDFEAREPGTRFFFSGGDTLRTILLVPRKPHNQIREIQVWFNDRYIIRHMTITDHFDSVTELRFENIELNTLPPGDPAEREKIIRFTVPPGTEVIDR